MDTNTTAAAVKPNSPRRWWPWTPLLFGVVLVSVICIVQFARPPEPSYHGKKLGQWLEKGFYWDGKNYQGGDSSELRTAIQTMGTNAVPYLLKLLHTPDYPGTLWVLKRRNMSWNDPLFVNLGFAAPFIKQNRAILGFEMLGAKAAYAVPDIIAASPRWAVLAVYRIGPSAFPAVSACLTNKEWRIRLTAVGALQAQYFNSDEVAALYADCLFDSNERVRHFAAACLKNPKYAHATHIIPKLEEAIHNRSLGVAIDVTAALKNINEAHPPEME